MELQPLRIVNLVSTTPAGARCSEGFGVPSFAGYSARKPESGRYFPQSSGCYGILLIPWPQSNVVIDHMGRALVTEYGLAPIICGPSFTATATPHAVGNTRWLAPEIMAPSRKPEATPVVESKAADVFAFSMFAVEVLTGRVPFEGLGNGEVVLHILRGGRPQMPTNAQEVGFTHEMWKFLESCWHQNPKKRPTMRDVVMRWQRFVEDSVITECVKIHITNSCLIVTVLNLRTIDSGSHCPIRSWKQIPVDPRRRFMPLPSRRGLRPFHPERNSAPFDSE